MSRETERNEALFTPVGFLEQQFADAQFEDAKKLVAKRKSFNFSFSAAAASAQELLLRTLFDFIPK